MRECLLEDWLEAVKRSYWSLRRDGTPVAVLGHCLGSVLALVTAPELNPRRLVCCAPPMVEPSKPMVKVCDREKGMMSTHEWFDHGHSQRTREWRLRTSHPRVPIEFYNLLEEAAGKAREALSSVRAPVLVVQGGADRISSQETGQELIEQVRSPRRKLILSRKSGHGLLLDTGRRKVFSEILQFLTEKENPAYNW